MNVTHRYVPLRLLDWLQATLLLHIPYLYSFRIYIRHVPLVAPSTYSSPSRIRTITGFVPYLSSSRSRIRPESVFPLSP